MFWIVWRKFDRLRLKVVKKTNIPWHAVTQGNTQKGVNRAILAFLHQKFEEGYAMDSLLDAPCGQGDFLKNFLLMFPKAQVQGSDLFCEPLPEVASFFKKGDLLRLFEGMGDQKFDVITNISGVMVVDHLSTYLPQARDHLKDKGFLILTNDNILTVRDRLSFLFFGRLKRFKLFFAPHEGNWNLVLIQGLWKQLVSNRLEIKKVQYTSFYWEDFLFLPIALIIYPIMWIHLRWGKGEMPEQDRKALFPFSALLGRHYIIFAQKQS